MQAGDQTWGTSLGSWFDRRLDRLFVAAIKFKIDILNFVIFYEKFSKNTPYTNKHV